MRDKTIFPLQRHKNIAWKVEVRPMRVRYLLTIGTFLKALGLRGASALTASEACTSNYMIYMVVSLNRGTSV